MGSTKNDRGVLPGRLACPVRWRVALVAAACCVAAWLSAECRGLWAKEPSPVTPSADPAARHTVSEVTQRASLRGGLVVILGSDNHQFAEQLVDSGRCLVHLLLADDAQVEAARARHVQAGRYGVVTVEQWNADRLPYLDRLVNAIIVGTECPIPDAEIRRVLAPGGACYRAQDEGFSVEVKPVPGSIDEWTHPWHGPDGALVTEDREVGVPTGLQWITGPLFAMADRKSSTQCLVSAGGRNFYVTQNTVDNLGRPEKRQYLVCRDAYSGLPLWQQPWSGPFTTGQGELNPRLVATAERLYLAGQQGVTVLDAATGKTLRQYETRQPPRQLFQVKDLLVCELGTGLAAFNTVHHTPAWTYDAPQVDGAVVSGDEVYVLSGGRADDGRFRYHLAAVNLATGQERFRLDVSPWTASRQLRINLVTEDVIALQAHGSLHVFDRATANHLWSQTTDARPGKDYSDERYVGHFHRHGLIWMLVQNSPKTLNGQNVWLGLDPRSGKEVKRLVTSGLWPETATPAKMGCQWLVAGDRYIMIPRQATFVDFETGEKHPFKFVRGGCGMGFVPANGLLFGHPHACGCYTDALRGFVALHSREVQAADNAPRLMRGAAYGQVEKSAPWETPADTNTWPTHRHDAARSGSTPAEVPASLKQAWKVNLLGDAMAENFVGREWELRAGSPVTAPTIDGGQVYVALPNLHQVIALDAETGDLRWRYTAAGRIDSPPTLVGGLCLFGSHDGHVYCLRATDGALVWRFRAARDDRRMVAFGQLESPWPVAGAVLVHGGLAFAAAGRAPDADGGIDVFALDPATGEVAWQETVSEGFTGLSDYLVGVGDHVFLSYHRFSVPKGNGMHAKKADDAKSLPNYLQGGKAGLLESSWTCVELASRKAIQDWNYGKVSAQLLAMPPGERVFGYRVDGTLFAEGGQRPWKFKVPQPFQVEAMIVAGNRLLVAGPRDRNGRRGAAILLTLDAQKGTPLARFDLPANVAYDGLAAAGGKLYLSLADGSIVCLK